MPKTQIYFIMKKQLLFVLFLAIICSSFSQERYWKKTNTYSKNSVINSKKDLPNKNLFSLEIQLLKDALSNVPKRFDSNNQRKTIIKFPNTSGFLEQFYVYEASVLHPDLAYKYPEIKSYIGQGITDPSARIRFSISHKGLHGMKLSGSTESVFIEPYTQDLATYTVYTRSEKPKVEERLQCIISDHASSTSRNNTQKNADDGILRTYRIAISTTGEYTQYHGGTKADALAAINTTMTRVNGVFENDFNVTMVVIANNEDIIYTDGSSDPYTGSFNTQLQNTLTAVIGEAAYDIGHLFVKGGNNGNAGCIGCVCVDGRKGKGFTSRGIPEGDAFDIDYVAHEIGHQFGANHTFSFRNEGTDAHFEPGSGSTIMGYAGITGNTDVQDNSDPYFHSHSIEQVTNYVKSTSCQTNTNTNNTTPEITAGNDYTIPKGTPFVLTGHAIDDDGDTLTYCWEQRDENNAMSTYPSTTATTGVSFRSFTPTLSNKRYFPRLETIKSGATSWQWEAVPEVARDLNFRLTVRDNKLGGGASTSDDIKLTVVDNAGPFILNSPNSNVSWQVNSTQTITWNVANTNVAPILATTVDLFLSTDGGDTYGILLASNVTNDGSHDILVPNQIGDQNRVMIKASNNVFFDISNTDFEITPGDSSDTEVPTIPTNVSVSNITQTSATIYWDAATDNIEVVGYDLYQNNDFISTSTITEFDLINLNPDTTYSIALKAKDAAGNMSDFSNSVTFITLPSDTNDQCINGISSYPYTQGFEDNLGNWTQSTTDDFDWSFNSGTTPSNGTGPNSAIEGNSYLYLESSSPNYPSKEAIITSPCFDLSNENNATFEFNYHMFGANNMGDLSLDISDDNATTWTTIWSASGNQGNTWITQSIDLSVYTGSNIQLRFKGTTGSTWKGDIAIDKLSLITTVSNPDCTEVTLSINLDDYPEETSWQIINESNEIMASGDNYNSSTGEILVTVCLPEGTYTFTINDSYGDGICCQYGNGSYSLTTGSTPLANGGQFGTSESTTFTLRESSRDAIVQQVVSTTPIEISIYPNPIQQNIPLNVSSHIKELTYTITDLTGRIIQKGNLNGTTIDLQQVNSGVYIIHFDTGQKVISKKIIKK